MFAVEVCGGGWGGRLFFALRPALFCLYSMNHCAPKDGNVLQWVIEKGFPGNGSLFRLEISKNQSRPESDLEHRDRELQRFR